MNRAHDLYELLEEGTSLGIVCHTNPDPDSLASALGLKYIAADVGLSDVAILYSGTISHQQNRAFVNLLEVDLVAFTPSQLASYDLLAFVDHTEPGVNNEVPPDTNVDIIIDHHPTVDINARFVDHREEIGATTTIITEYLQELSLAVDEPLATALLFAIRRETLGLLRGATPSEYAAAGFLHPHVDRSLLRKLVNPPLTPATVDAVGRAIKNREIRSACLVSHTGRTVERDALPQAADYLVNLESVTTAVIAGIIEETIQLSARSIDPRIHVGTLLQEAFNDVGSAGGHSEMAGGQIPLGLFADWVDEEDAVATITSQLVAQRVFAALHLADNSAESD
jgi:nanoRNase/pAp phosphatase (c-di-AMP/oligoRNAs hydrolase)